MKKNLLLLLFVLAAAFNLTADILSEDYTLRLSDDGKTVITAVGKPTSVAIPNGVTTIGKGAFYDCDSLMSVTIGNGVTTIGDSAFSVCDSLMSVTIGNGVTTIERGAFNGCKSLTNITIPNSVTTIEHGAFSGCFSQPLINYDGAESDWHKIKFEGNTGLKGKTIVGRNRAAWTHTGN